MPKINPKTMQAHNEVLYPTVLVRTRNASGSGTVLYSKLKDKSNSEYETYVLTNHHVIDECIKISKEWDPMLEATIKKETRSTVNVEFYRYKHYSRCIGRFSVEADIVTYSKDQDIALLRLRSVEKVPAIAHLYLSNIKDIHVFDKVVACGCQLAHPPIHTRGEIMFMDDEIENYNFWLSNAQIIFGSCLPGDTNISMSDNSVKYIKDIEKGDYVWSVDSFGLNKQKVLEKIEAGPKMIYELKTATRTIKASNNHPFLIIKSAKAWNRKRVNWLEWTQLKDIKSGDIIASLSKLPDRTRPVDFNFGKIFSQSKNPNDIMRFIGFFLGDGWYRERKGISYDVSLAVYDKKDYEMYFDIMSRIFDKMPSIVNPDVITLYSKKAVEIMKKVGIHGKATEKIIPNWIFTLPNEFQRSFLQGYLEADGYVNSVGDWVFEANNAKLIDELRMLCIHMGFRVSNIFSRMRKPTYFAKENRMITPNEKSYSFHVAPNSEKTGLTLIQGSKENIHSELIYETICSINEIGSEMTYDLHIQGCHNFFANGILVHNSGGGIYLNKNSKYEFIGIPSRIAISGWSDAVTHMGYFIPIDRIFEWLKEEYYHFIYDSKTNPAKCEKLRDRKKLALKKSFLEKQKSELEEEEE